MFSWTSGENNRLADDTTQHALGDPDMVWIEDELNILIMNSNWNY